MIGNLSALNFFPVASSRSLTSNTPPKATDQDEKFYELLIENPDIYGGALSKDSTPIFFIGSSGGSYTARATDNQVIVYFRKDVFDFNEWKVQMEDKGVELVKEEKLSPYDGSLPPHSRSSPTMKKLTFELLEGSNSAVLLFEKVNPRTGETVQGFGLRLYKR